VTLTTRVYDNALRNARRFRIIRIYRCKKQTKQNKTPRRVNTCKCGVAVTFPRTCSREVLCVSPRVHDTYVFSCRANPWALLPVRSSTGCDLGCGDSKYRDFASPPLPRRRGEFVFVHRVATTVCSLRADSAKTRLIVKHDCCRTLHLVHYFRFRSNNCLDVRTC